jgi:hypothetical protein
VQPPPHGGFTVMTPDVPGVPSSSSNGSGEIAIDSTPDEVQVNVTTSPGAMVVDEGVSVTCGPEGVGPGPGPGPGESLPPAESLPPHDVRTINANARTREENKLESRMVNTSLLVRRQSSLPSCCANKADLQAISWQAVDYMRHLQ